LTKIDGIIFMGHRIVIPRDLRRQTFRTHGSGKVPEASRDIIFWPGMSADITKMVLECRICLERRNSNSKEPLISHDVPEYPWETIATDFFTWNN
jgi:hypothetical protein